MFGDSPGTGLDQGLVTGLQPKSRPYCSESLVIVRILDHQVDAFARIKDFLLFRNLAVVVDLHAPVDLDAGFSWRWRVGLLLLVVLQSFVEPSLLRRHSSFGSPVRRLAPSEVGVCQVHLAGVRRIGRSLVA